MIIAKFCEGRGVDAQAVRKYIIRHPEIFDGHTGKKGREITLDPIAFGVLDEKYPVLKPVQVVNGVDPEEHMAVLEKLNEAKDLLLKAEETNSKLKLELSSKDADLFLLESKNETIIEERDNLVIALSSLEKAYEEQKEDIPKRIKAAEDNLKNELQEEFNLQKSELEQKHQEELEAEKHRKLTIGEAIKRVLGK